MKQADVDRIWYGGEPAPLWMRLLVPVYRLLNAAMRDGGESSHATRSRHGPQCVRSTSSIMAARPCRWHTPAQGNPPRRDGFSVCCEGTPCPASRSS